MFKETLKKLFGIITILSLMSGILTFSAYAGANPLVVTGAGNIQNFPVINEDNLIINGSFENGESAWLNNDKARYKIVADASSPDGNHYLQYTAGTDSSYKGNSAWYEPYTSDGQGYIPVHVLPNTRYSLSFYYRAQYNGTEPIENLDLTKGQIVQISNERNAEHYIVRNRNNPNENDGISAEAFIFDGEWHKITANINTKNDRKLFVKAIRAVDEIPGMVYSYDDFQLKRLGEGEIVNGGFEDGIAPWFTYKRASNEAKLSLETADSYNGNNSLKLVTGTNDSWTESYYTHVPLEYGASYNLSFYYKCDMNNAVAVRLRSSNLKQWSGATSLGNSANLVDTEGEWVKCEIPFTNNIIDTIDGVPVENTGMVIQLRDITTSEATCYFDDFSLERTSAPSTPVTRITITANGADTLNDTQIIQDAFDTATSLASPGNNVEVYFPAGTYYTSMLALQSNTTVILADGATIKADPANSAWKSASVPLLFGLNVRNCYIRAENEGMATIDCSGLDGTFHESNGDRKNVNRPDRTMHIKDSKGVRIEGLNFINSVNWTVHLNNCDYVFVDGLNIRNPRDGLSKNTDGIDINGCRNVTVQNCDIETGDDAICLKNINIHNNEIPFLRQPMYNILVKDCVIASECNGTKIGTETVGDISDVLFENITVNKHSENGTRSMISAISLQSNDGAVVDNITARNYTINDVSTPVFLVLQNRGRGPQRPMGKIQNVLVENIDVIKSSNTSEINAAIDATLENITFKNWTVDNYSTNSTSTPPSYPNGNGNNGGTYPEAGIYGSLPAYGLFARNVDGLELTDLTFNDAGNSGRQEIYLQDVVEDQDAQYPYDLADCEVARDMFSFTVPSTLTESITLPSSSGAQDVTLTWTTSNAFVLTAEGVVTRPSYAEGDAPITLTAKFTKGTASAQKVYQTTVIKKDQTEPVIPPVEVERAPNMIPNGSFETAMNPNDSKALWRDNAGLGQFSIVSSDSVDGDYSLKFTSVDKNGNEGRYFELNSSDDHGYDPIPISPYTYYEFSYYFKGVNTSGGALPTFDNQNDGPRVDLHGRGPADKYNLLLAHQSNSDLYKKGHSKTPYIIDGEWHKMTYVVYSEQASELYVKGVRECSYVAGMEYYYDDFYLAPLDMSKIINGGFEYGLSSWVHEENSPNLVMELDTTEKNTGSASLKVTTGGGKRNIFHSNIRVRKNTSYKLSFYHKNSGTGKMDIRIDGVNGTGDNAWEGGGSTKIIDNEIPLESGWTLCEKTFNSGNYEKIVIKLVDSTSGGVWNIDDVSLEETVPSSWASSSVNCITRGSNVSTGITFDNYSGEDIDTVIVVALYNKADNTLVRIKNYEHTFINGHTSAIRPPFFGIDNSEKGSTYMKTFVWEDGSLKPFGIISSYDSY